MIVINKRFKESLKLKFKQGCENSIDLIRENTPIDTQRLYESIDVSEPEINDCVINCKITLGGKELYGIRREQDIKKPVNYAIYVESRNPFIRPLLTQITQTIIERFKK